MAYTITKAIVERAGAALAKVHVALSDFNPSQATDPLLNGGCPLHPGAARHYREAGILK